MLKVTTLLFKEATEMKVMQNKDGGFGRRSIFLLQGCLMKAVAAAALTAGMAVLAGSGGGGELLPSADGGTGSAHWEGGPGIAGCVRIR